MAYINTFTIVQVDPPGTDQSFMMILQFTGNAGEPAVRREYRAGRTTTPTELRQWAFGVVAELNDKRSAYTTAVGAVGQNLTTLAPSASVPTAQTIWREKVNRYHAVQGLGLAGQIATDLAALKADIEATYDSSYL